MARTGAVLLFNLLVSGATIVSGRMLEGAPQLPIEGRREGEVLVIVPARDEARNIERATRSLLESAARYGAAHVLVVDDGSTDGTDAQVERLRQEHPEGARLSLLRLEGGLPEGWMGKPHACWEGAQTSRARRAEWLLFVDADTDSDPRLIERLVAGAVAAGADLYSIFGHQILGGVAERLVMPHLFYALAVGFPWRRVNDPESPIAIANGQCILIRRALYDRIGGHRAVRDEIAEDKALAEQVKAAGGRLWLAEGREVLSVRMYTSLGELWEGWSKNAYLGLGDRAWLLLVAIFFGLAGGVLPFVAFPLALRRGRGREALAWATTLAIVLQNRDRAMREFRVPRLYALTLPVGALICCAIALNAWYAVVSGRGVTWKGRRYGVGD